MTRHKVHFFGIETLNRDIEDHPAVFENICSEIVNLPVEDKNYEFSGTLYRLASFERTHDYFRGKIVKFRTNHMITGSISDDTLTDFELDRGQRFTEVSHFIYSPDTRILSFEYNHNGPRYGIFMGYLNALQAKYLSDPIVIVADLLMHPDITQKIQEAHKIKSLTIGLPVAKMPTQLEQNNLLKGLAAGAQFGNAGQVYLTITGARKRGDGTPLISIGDLMTAIQTNEVDLGILGKADIEILTNLGSETVNLLENKLESSKSWSASITTENSDAWFRDMKDMYLANRPTLLRSLEAYAE